MYMVNLAVPAVGNCFLSLLYLELYFLHPYSAAISLSGSIIIRHASRLSGGCYDVTQLGHA